MKKHSALFTFSVLAMFLIASVSSPLLGTVETALAVRMLRSTLNAGGSGEIEIELVNIGAVDVVDVKAHLQIPTALTGIAILRGSYQVFDRVSASSSVSMDAELTVSATLPQGAVSLLLNLVYNKEGDLPITDNLPVGIVINAAVPSYSFDAAVDDYHVVAGAEKQLAVLIRNMGESDVYNLEAGFVSTNPQVAILKNATTQLGGVTAGSSFLLKPTIGLAPTLPLGPVTLGLSLKFQGVNGVPSATSLSIGLFVNSTMPSSRPAVHVRQYIVSPQEISPGGLFSFIAEVENSGATVTDLQAVLTVPPTTPFALSGPALRYLGALRNGQRLNASFSLTAVGDAAARYYPVQLSITYFDNSDIPGTVSETVSIPIHGLQSFQLINIAPSAPSGTPDSEVTFDADLLLIGTESARFVQAEVLESDEFKLASSSTVHIGFVDPDSPVPFSLGFRVSSAAAEGEHILNVGVSYWDSYDVEKHQNIQITVTVSQSQGGQEAQRNLTIYDWLKILFGIRP